MKHFTRLLLVAVMALGCVATASAQFKIGPRVGFNVNDLHFNSTVLDANNRTGFTGGLQCEFTVPLIGLGFDLSVMYVHRYNTLSSSDNNKQYYTDLNNDNFKKKDYIEIPLNLKYKLSLPLVSKIVKPYLATGPSFAFLTSRKAISDAYKNSKVDYSWNFGFGLELFNHLQVGASYGLGLNNTLKVLKVVDNPEKIECKNRAWTITAAYLF